MGYSHYWGRPPELDPARFLLFAEECKALRRAAGMPWLGLFGGLKVGGELGWGAPSFTKELVCFNGRPQCEPLVLPCHLPMGRQAVGDYGLYWDGAKTNKLPYDQLVVAALLSFKSHFHEAALYSDGDRDDWSDGIQLYERVTGKAVPPLVELGRPLALNMN